MKSFSNLALSALLLASVPAFAGTPDQADCNVWQLACHYTAASRPSTYAINRVVVHKTEGATAASAASWFANSNSGGSAHYTYDKSNGHCYQSVREKDVAWHAGYSSTNNNSVGIEHSGWINSNDTSKACYDRSGWETRGCSVYYGVPWSRTNIIGHSQVPGCANPGGGGKNCHTDPGIYWDWTYYMSASCPRVSGDIRNKWLSVGGSRHYIGNPTTTQEMSCPDGWGKYSHFERGSIYWHPNLGGSWIVMGAIRDKWAALGWEQGICNYPTSDEFTCADGVGKGNNFYGRNGWGASIFWHPNTGANCVWASIRTKWVQLGADRGICGYPTSDEFTCADGVGKGNNFTGMNNWGASIFWHPTTGAYCVWAAIRTKWVELGADRGTLGYPTSDEYTVPGTSDKRNNFQRGTLTWHASNGVVTMP